MEVSKVDTRSFAMSAEGLSDMESCERCGEQPCDCSDPGRVDPWTGLPGFSTAQQVSAFLPEIEDHQPEEEDVFVPTEAEKDVAKSPLRRSNATVNQRSFKRERSPPVPIKSVRLDEFFDMYDTPMALRVTMCRAYASFVASTLPKKAKK